MFKKGYSNVFTEGYQVDFRNAVVLDLRELRSKR
jgi:hypothetical protein